MPLLWQGEKRVDAISWREIYEQNKGSDTPSNYLTKLALVAGD